MKRLAIDAKTGISREEEIPREREAEFNMSGSGNAVETSYMTEAGVKQMIQEAIKAMETRR